MRIIRHIQTGTEALKNDLFKLASQLNNEVVEMRRQKIRSLIEQIHQAESQGNTEILENLKTLHRRQAYGLLRTDPLIEKRLRMGKTGWGVPFFNEMSRSQWDAASGPMHVRFLGKAYGILGPILPYEAESLSHVELNFGDLSSKYGNFIIPSGNFFDPKIIMKECNPEKYYSTILIDADMPSEENRKRVQFILWAKTNLKCDTLSNNSLAATPDKEDHLPYWPPHPARGSDTHRFIAVVLEHSSPLSISNNDRITDLRKLISGNEVFLVGYQFFRSCWTKVVSTFYERIGLDEPVYGEVLEAKSPAPSKYLVS